MGTAFGKQRFESWQKSFYKFLDQNLPGESSKLIVRLSVNIMGFIDINESDAERFWRNDGEIVSAFIESLILDIKNCEYEPDLQPNLSFTNQAEEKEKNISVSNRVFIVHGHDELAKTNAARFVEKLGFNAIILHEQASRGKTIIEKIEAYTDVGFAIILYTPDDQGNSQAAVLKGDLKCRARQNVVFEHGYLIAKLGREHVVPLVSEGVELPSDISGVVYVKDKNWQIEIAREMKSVGYDIDFNRLL